MKVKMLTKNDCPQCAALKMFLKFGLNDKYADDIEVVNKETDTAEFEKLTSEYGILTLPVMIAEGEVLTRPQPTPVVAFLEKYVGKK
ncbi:MAG TPA: glutaredoxin domain-containing protein [Acholeplasma sp.]|jgi:glutaredoxin-like protein NrdH